MHHSQHAIHFWNVLANLVFGMPTNIWLQAKKMSFFVENIRFLNCFSNFGNNQKSQEPDPDYRADAATPWSFWLSDTLMSSLLYGDERYRGVK